MFKKILVSLFLYFLNLLIPTTTYAEGEFETNYDLIYEIDSLGVTQITEIITLKNLTDKFYPSNFSLTIGATSIDEVTAFDSQGFLPTAIHNFDKKTKIEAKLVHQQVVGKDKQYSFTLKFKTKDFASRVGKIWQVFIPKIQTSSGKDNYHLSLFVPVAFGDPANIIPEPDKVSETGGKLKLDFTKEKLEQSGILANFGTDQALDFKLIFNIFNTSLLPKEYLVPLPPDTSYQQVSIKSIEPNPENVILDKDGNYLALFRLNRNQGLSVTVTGSSLLYAMPFLGKQTLTPKQEEEYKSSQKFWEKDSIQIKAKSKEILLESKTNSSIENAKLINNFVSSNLQFDNLRVKNNDFTRLGALAALNNAAKALSSEFTDLFIALARSSDIPARALIGYAYSNNPDLRPLSFEGAKMHTWPEYYDPENGWVMIDPTWQSSSGGVDYFSNLDLNHFVTFIRGQSSQEPYPLASIEALFTDVKIEDKPKIKLELDVQDEIYSGFPAKAKVKIINVSGIKYDRSKLTVSSSNLKITGINKSESLNILTPPIPPFGRLEYEYDLRSPYVWQSFDDIISVKVGEKYLDKKVLVRPIFAYKFFPQIIGILILTALASYVLILGFHLKSPRGHRVK